MSHIAELARQEADRVEAEEAAEQAAAEATDDAGKPHDAADAADGESGADGATERPAAVASPPAAPDAGPTEAELKLLEKEQRRHEKALQTIMGDSFSLFEPCEPCGGMGVVPAGQTGAPELLHDPERTTCARCNGYGLTLTGAKPPGVPEMPCTGCGGNGWITVAVVIQPTQPIAGEITQPPQSAANGPMPEAPPGYILVKTA